MTPEARFFWWIEERHRIFEKSKRGFLGIGGPKTRSSELIGSPILIEKTIEQLLDNLQIQIL